jgi:hypothetical protein
VEDNVTIRRGLRALFFCSVFGGLAATAAAQVPANAVSLEGMPASRVETTAEGTTRQQLTGAEATRSGLRIRIDSGRYYWSSRRDQPLTLTAAGEFTYLMSNEPGHYVRIRRLTDRATYVEHLETPLGSVTYWGELRIVLGK